MALASVAAAGLGGALLAGAARPLGDKRARGDAHVDVASFLGSGAVESFELLEGDGSSEEAYEEDEDGSSDEDDDEDDDDEEDDDEDGDEVFKRKVDDDMDGEEDDDDDDRAFMEDDEPREVRAV
jgi:hypothetical protein